MVDEKQIEPVLDELKAGLTERESYTRFVENNAAKAGAMADGHKKLKEALLNAKDRDRDAIEELLKTLSDKESELLKHSEKSEKGIFSFTGDDHKAFAESYGAYQSAKTKLLNFLAGKEAYKLEKEEAKDAKKASGELQKAYSGAVKATGSVSGILDGLFGDVSIWGLQSTAERNLKFWDHAVTEGRAPVVFARAGGVGVGLAMAADAVVRNRTMGCDDKRGSFPRLAELVAGLGIAGTSAFAGKAR